MAATVAGFAAWVMRMLGGKGLRIQTLEESEGRIVLQVTDGNVSCRVTIENLQ